MTNFQNLLLPLSNNLYSSLRRASGVIAVFLTIIISSSVSAQNYPHEGNSRANNAYVTVFEDCNFRGKSRSLAVGDYRNVRDLKLGNDSISSVRVPGGVQISIFEHERFRGKSTTLNRDVACLNREWDNETSSMRVSYAQNNSGQYQSNSGSHQGAHGSQDSSSPRSDSPGSDSPTYGTHDNSSQAAGNYGDQHRNQNVDTAKLSKVWFANTAIERSGNKQWRIVNANGSTDTFREVRRDPQVIYLQNNRNPQSLQIDLNSNQLRFLVPGGKTIAYNIVRVEQGRKGNNTDFRAGNKIAKADPGIVHSRCFKFKAYARGGQGAVKFHGHQKSFQFGKKTLTDSICHDGGSLTMEVNKMKPSTEVVVRIEGKKYRFAPNEAADEFKNNWYRKKFRLKVKPN